MWHMVFFQTRDQQEIILKLNVLDIFQTRKNPEIVGNCPYEKQYEYFMLCGAWTFFKQETKKKQS